jgi:hypothetical protein
LTDVHRVRYDSIRESESHTPVKKIPKIIF